MAKKNNRVKKSNNLLKGVAAAGAVVGGGTFLQNTNVVYAAGFENEQMATNELGSVIESQSTTESNTTSLSESTNSLLDSVSESSNSENSVSESELNSESDAIMLAELDSEEAISGGESEYFATFNTISNNLVKESLSISNVRSELLSQSVSLSEYASENSMASSESEFLSNSAFLQSQYEIEANYNSAYQDFSDERNEVLEEIIRNVEMYKVKLDEAQKYGYNSYCRVADQATVYLAQYYFYQSYGTGEITNNSSGWNSKDHSHGYERNNLYLEYTDVNNNTHIGFFDWVTLDSNGYVTTDSSKIADLVVIKKSPMYMDTAQGSTDRFYFYQGLDNITHVYHGVNIDGTYTYEDITDQVEVKETGKYTAEFTYNNNTYSTKMEENAYPEFAGVPNEIHYGNNATIVKGYPYASIKGFDKKEDQYASQRVNYESASVAKSQFESQSTSVQSKLNSESIAKQQESESISKSFSIQESQYKSQINSLEVFSQSTSESIKESKSIKNSQSVSESEYKSTSTSLSDSKSVVGSESASNSIEESESASKSVAGSESISTSLVNSKSVADSESASNSIKESKLASESESLSNTVASSENDLTSTSDSLSDSGSLNSSESTSNSSLEFESLIDSDRASVSSTSVGSNTVRNIVIDTSPAPLQVVRNDFIQSESVEEMITPMANNEETIDEDITPIADASKKVFWSWVPILGTIAALKDTYGRRNDKSDEDEDEIED